MGLSDCECGGFIALGPTASNRCDKCGEGPFGRARIPAFPDAVEQKAIQYLARAERAESRVAELEVLVASKSKEVYALRYFGNKDCTAQADKWLETQPK